MAFPLVPADSPLARVPNQPEVCAARWLNSAAPCPAWQGRPTRLCLPADLIWSAAFAVPEIGSRVQVRMNGFGPALVKAYFHADGYLGLVCQPDVLPDWFRKQEPGVTLGHFFGREVSLLPVAPVLVAPAA